MEDTAIWYSLQILNKQKNRLHYGYPVHKWNLTSSIAGVQGTIFWKCKVKLTEELKEFRNNEIQYFINAFQR